VILIEFDDCARLVSLLCAGLLSKSPWSLDRPRSWVETADKDESKRS
jgi:hypothetical protein